MVEATGITGTTATSAANAAQSRIAGDFDSFLKLLTTQLQHQDPLSPMDTTEFTNQLVGFAGVEQQIAQNSNLEQLISLQKVSRAAQGLSFLNTRIEAPGDMTTLADGVAEWNYQLPTAMREVVIQVLDESGQTVLEADGSTIAGVHRFTWDGKNADGEPMPDGVYQVSIEATDTADEPVAIDTTVVGKVTGLQTVDDELMLFMGKLAVPLEDVLSVQADTNDTPATPEQTSADT
jgi:flagellar basal-body rod modification protein FlgD